MSTRANARDCATGRSASRHDLLEELEAKACPCRLLRFEALLLAPVQKVLDGSLELRSQFSYCLTVKAYHGANAQNSANIGANLPILMMTVVSQERVALQLSRPHIRFKSRNEEGCHRSLSLCFCIKNRQPFAALIYPYRGGVICP